MPFPDDNRSLTNYFGASATNDAGVLRITLSELPDVTSPASLSAEGVLLAIIKQAVSGQGDDEDRKIVLVEQPSTIVRRNTLDTLRERFTIDVFHTHDSSIDPDDL